MTRNSVVFTNNTFISKGHLQKIFFEDISSAFYHFTWSDSYLSLMTESEGYKFTS